MLRQWCGSRVALIEILSSLISAQQHPTPSPWPTDCFSACQFWFLLHLHLPTNCIHAFAKMNQTAASILWPAALRAEAEVHASHLHHTIVVILLCLSRCKGGYWCTWIQSKHMYRPSKVHGNSNSIGWKETLRKTFSLEVTVHFHVLPASFYFTLLKLNQHKIWGCEGEGVCVYVHMGYAQLSVTSPSIFKVYHDPYFVLQY